MKSTAEVRPYLLAATLGLVLALAAYSFADTYADTQELKEFVQQQFRNANMFPEGFVSAELAIDAVVSHKYLVFGEPTGRGSIYTRARTTQNQVVYWGVDYHCTWNKGNWQLDDSALYLHDRELRDKTTAALSKGRYAFIKS